MQPSEIIKQLKDTASTNQKLQILREHKDNFALKWVFKAAYDPLISYFVTSKNVTKSTYRGDLDFNATAFKLIFDKLSNREVTGHAALDFINENLDYLNESSQNLFLSILDRDLRCGVTATLANKVWPDLIQDWPCMLAMKDEPKNRKKFKFPVFAQVKADAMRCNLIVNTETQTVEAFSRNGKSVDCLSNQMRSDALMLVGSLESPCWVLDGELYVDDNGKPASRTISNGIGNKAVRGTVSDEERNSFRMVLWDIIPLNVFREEVKSEIYENRFDRLEKLCKAVKPTNLSLIESRIAVSWKEAQDFYVDVLTNGGEGLIIKSFDGVWENKRSNSACKMKEVIEDEFEIIGIEEGSGKYKGMLGAFIIASKDHSIIARCGSGFTDSDRVEYFTENVVGKICTIKYNALIEDKKTKQKSLFLPIFSIIREDRNEAD